jgi:hypothetical protein
MDARPPTCAALVVVACVVMGAVLAHAVGAFLR